MCSNTPETAAAHRDIPCVQIPLKLLLHTQIFRVFKYPAAHTDIPCVQIPCCTHRYSVCSNTPETAAAHTDIPCVQIPLKLLLHTDGATAGAVLGSNILVPLDFVEEQDGRINFYLTKTCGEAPPRTSTDTLIKSVMLR